MTKAHDPYTDHLVALGKQVKRDHANWSISRCNCMVRYNGGSQMPAIKDHKKDEFTDPEGRPIVKPTSWEMMAPEAIVQIMKQRNEVYIGHIYGDMKP